MYEVANEIFGDAGVFGWTDISDVAHSLCGVLDSTSEMQGDVVAVHVQALTALSEMNPAEDQAARRAVVAGLKSLARRKTGGTAHAA